MSRDYSAESQAAVSSEVVRHVHLIDLEFDAYTLHVSDAFKDLDWEGITYMRGGNLIGFSDIEESSALLVHQVTLSLSGVDQSMIGLVLAESYIDRPVRIWRGFLNEEYKRLVSVEPLFEGRINQPAVAEDPDGSRTSTVSIQVSSAWVDFERSPGRRTNHEQQQQWFPGDLGFQFAGQAFSALPWGRGLAK